MDALVAPEVFSVFMRGAVSILRQEPPQVAEVNTFGVDCCACQYRCLQKVEG